MKVYCARVEEVERSNPDNTYTNIIYVGEYLDVAIAECASYVCVGTMYEVESKTIDVWEFGAWITTLNENGDEWDFEN